MAGTASKIFMILASLWPATLSIAAQQPGRAKPAPKSAGRPASQAEDQSKQAESLFDAGQTAHQAGRLDEAIRLYSDALKSDPELWQAEYQRAAAYFSLKKYAEAKTSLNRTAELLKGFGDSPQAKQMSAKAQTTLGEVALAEANAAEAETAFRRALEFNPQAAQAHSGLAEALLTQNKSQEAANEAKAALAAGDDRAATYLLLGVALSLGGNFADALPALDAAVKRDEKNAQALLARAEANIALKKLKEAVADLRASYALDPAQKTRQRLARALAEAREYDESVKLYREILKDDPANSEAQTAIAAAMIDSGKGDEAITQLESLVKAEPARAGLRAQLAELYLAKQPEKALEQYAEAAKLEPTQAGYKIGEASALVKLRRFDQAIALLRPLLGQTLREDQAYVAHANLATALFELDDFANAAREYLWMLDHQRDQKRAALTLYFLGICLDKLGDYPQALKAYQQFLKFASADNQLEIDKVNLRLPIIERQIKEGKGKRKS
jgi:tetratricopeptide (TPR) repeat protein